MCTKKYFPLISYEEFHDACISTSPSSMSNLVVLTVSIFLPPMDRVVESGLGLHGFISQMCKEKEKKTVFPIDCSWGISRCIRFGHADRHQFFSNNG